MQRWKHLKYNKFCDLWRFFKQSFHAEWWNLTILDSKKCLYPTGIWKTMLAWNLEEFCNPRCPSEPLVQWLLAYDSQPCCLMNERISFEILAITRTITIQCLNNLISKPEDQVISVDVSAMYILQSPWGGAASYPRRYTYLLVVSVIKEEKNEGN